MSRYAPLSAQKDFERGKHCGTGAVVFKPLWTFVRTYLLKGGILDGHTGYVISRLSATYTLVKFATLYHLCRENTH
jgi:hypothetical protein